MSPDEKALYEQSLTDLDVFITGFEKQSRGPNGERFAEPLERLRLIKKNLIKLQKRGTKRHKEKKKTGESSVILDRIEQTSQNNLQILRSDLQSLSSSTASLKSGLKRLEGLEKQLLSIGQSTMEAAGQVGGLVKKVQQQVSQASSQSPALPSAPFEKLAEDFGAKFRDFQTKLIGMARNMNSLDRRISEETDLVVDLTETVEKRFTALEAQVQSVVSTLNAGDLIEQLKQVANQTGNQTADGKSADSDSSTSTQVKELLDVVINRLSAIDSLSMVLHPLSNSYQQLSLGLDERDKKNEESNAKILEELAAIRKVLEQNGGAPSSASSEKPENAGESEAQTAAESQTQDA